MAEFPYFRRNRALAGAAAAGGVRARPRIFDLLQRLAGLINIWFWAIVGVPTIVAAVYFFGMASSLYSSEAKFVVRAPAKMTTPNIGALLSGSSAAMGSEDTYAVADFIMSRDAVARLDKEANLRAVLDRPEGDIVSKFPGVLSLGRHDFEALYKSYERFVSIEIDGQTGVATLLVKAYRPEDAQAVARALMSYSEQLINAMNERARQDALAAFETEVADTKKHIESVQAQLTEYRVKQKMLDPKTAAAGPLETLAKLTGQQTAMQTQLADLMKNSPHSPQIRLVQNRIATLERQINEERAKVTGPDGSVVAALTGYERLNVDLGLDEKQLGSAFASLEAARLEAQRQQIYLETITQPNLADYPIFPKRLTSFAVVTVSCLLIYAIAWLLIASVREHAAT